MRPPIPNLLADATPQVRRARLGLRAKLLASVVLYLGLLALVGLLGLYAAQASLAGFDLALEHHLAELSGLSDIAEQVNRVHSTVLLHVVAETPNDRARYEQRLSELEASVEGLLDEQLQIQRRFADAPDVDRVEHFRAVWQAYLLQRDQDVLPLSRANRDAEALRLVEPNGALDLSYQRMTEELATVQDTLEAESRERLQASKQDFERNRDLLLGTLLLAGVFGIAFGLSQSSRLARTITGVSRAARRVAAGDFTQRLDLRTGDEIESLANSFNTMTTNLQRMHEEHREVERLKDEFVSMVSHELRTPMNGVLGMTDLLLAGDLAPRERRYAVAARRSGEALLGIVNDILDVSKIEAGKLDLERIDLDVRATASEVIELFAERAAGKGVKLSAWFDEAVPQRVLGDPGRVRQVLTNLIGNAVKFTPGGSVNLRVTLAAEGVLRFAVSDTGIGIAPEALERVFEPFTQADGSTTRTYGGTGLGLSVCKRLVGAMGGQIGLVSELGVSSTFWFTLPYGLPPTQPTSSSAPDASAASSLEVPDMLAQRTRGHARVLLVEDSWINEQVGLGMLERLGYAADVVSNGHDALVSLMSGEQYAAVLMDCQMPVLDGYQTTAEIRRYEAREPTRARVPIIAFTASAMAGDRERCLAAGMSDYVAKPVSLADLARVLDRWIGNPSQRASEATPAEPLAQPAGDAVLDPAALEAVRRVQRPGRPDLLAAVLERFLADVPAQLASLRAAAEAADHALLREVAHKLKGDSGRIGARQVQRLCADLETLARDAGSVSDAISLVAALEAAVARLEPRLRALLQADTTTTVP